MQGFVRHWTFLPPWELAYNLWAQWLWGFTWLSISSFVVAIGLAYVAVTRCREDAPFFGRWALAVLFGAYLVLPYAAGNWFHVGSRLIPYLWVAALVRVPDTLDRRVTALLAASAALYSAGMGLDYVRLDRDRAELTAGMSAVPEGSRLLPLLFRHKRTSENTRSLLHAWGFYVMEKLTDAPLLFACSRSFPLTYREPPPTRFHHLVLEWFAHDMRTPESSCRALRDAGVVVDCEDLYRSAWADFWRDATPRYDRVLLWEPTAEAIAQLPRAYEVAFRSERLTILARRAEATSAP
jgi:hypothetical protein